MEPSLRTATVALPELLRVAAMSGELRASIVEARVLLDDALRAGDWVEVRKLVGQLRDLDGWVQALQETLRDALRRAGRA